VWWGVVWCGVVWCGVVWCGDQKQAAVSMEMDHVEPPERMLVLWSDSAPCALLVALLVI
jgi:hypothetical protein